MSSSAPARVLQTLLPRSWYKAVRRFLLSFRNSVSMDNRQSYLTRGFQHYVLRRKPTLHHFEIHITDHCNLKCKSCGHYSNISPESFLDLQTFERDMTAARGYFRRVEQIFLMGGEPLLHPQVAEFVPAARRIFPETRICLMTNGLLVTRMPQAAWDALRESQVILLCDDYPINLPKERIAELSAENQVTLEWTEFNDRFFMAPMDARGGADPEFSYEQCQGYSQCPLLRDGKIYLCAPAGMSPILREHFGLQDFELQPKDGFDLLQPPTLARSWQALRFLSHPTPFCRFCDYTHFHRFAWGHPTTGQLSEWTQVQDNPLPVHYVPGSD